MRRDTDTERHLRTLLYARDRQQFALAQDYHELRTAAQAVRRFRELR